MSQRVDPLKKLQTTLVDSRSGYEEAVKDSDGRGLVTLFHEMVALRTQHIEEIKRHLIEMGEAAEDDASFMATVNRAVVSIRSVLTGLDTNVLPSMISSEQAILDDYDAVLRVAGTTDPAPAFLDTQRLELAAKIETMKVLRDKAAA